MQKSKSPHGGAWHFPPHFDLSLTVLNPHSDVAVHTSRPWRQEGGWGEDGGGGGVKKRAERRRDGRDGSRLSTCPETKTLSRVSSPAPPYGPAGPRPAATTPLSPASNHSRTSPSFFNHPFLVNLSKSGLCPAMHTCIYFLLVLK